MCWKAGDPWAFLNCQDSIKFETEELQYVLLNKVYELSKDTS